MNLVQRLLQALKAQGAGQVFGIPGDFALPLFRVIETAGILPLYTLSHEPAVGFAADAAARASMGLGVAAVTYGAGALNMVNAIAGAYAEKVPVVVVSGAPGSGEAGSGLLLHHQAKTLDSQFKIYREITCEQVRLDDAARAPLQIAQVLARCRRQSEPVYIEIPRDMAERPCGAVEALADVPVDEQLLDACAVEIVQRLAQARSPVLMVGVEVRRFGLEEPVALLGRRLGLPIVTSFMGRGLLASQDATLAGTYLGVAGVPEITQLVEGSDALFLLGEILSDTNFAVSQSRIDLRKAIQALDGRVSMGYHTYAPVPLPALIDALLQRATGPARPVPTMQPAVYPAGLADDDEPVTPNDIVAAINDLMAAHGRMPIAVDVGDCLFAATDIEPTALVAPGYYASMGYAVPAGLGLQAATGLRPLVLVGDGAFQMTGWELGNCRRYGWDPIVLIFNNGGWGMLRAIQPASPLHDLDRWDFAHMAEGMGGAGRHVATRRQLRQALEHAWNQRGRFQLIDIAIAPDAISQALQRFVAGVGRLNAAH